MQLQAQEQVQTPAVVRDDEAAAAAAALGGSDDDDGQGDPGWSLRRAMAPVLELCGAVAAAASGAWRRWYLRLPLLLGGGLLAFAAALGLLLAPLLERLVLPGLVSQGRELMQREVGPGSNRCARDSPRVTAHVRVASVAA